MLRAALYVLVGYISGSVTYASVFAALLHRGDIVSKSPDKNPGTANAFTYGGFACGVLTLLFDILKGLIPVWAFLNTPGPVTPYSLTFVVAAPVVGHAFSVFRGFRGGKAIAVSFGVLLGLMPMWRPAVTLAFFFIFFSLVLKITPNFYKTAAAFLASALALALSPVAPDVWLGFIAITAVVCVKLHASAEERDKIKVKLLWMR